MIETIRENLPDYAKDLKLNLSSLMREPHLDETQRHGVLVAASLAGRNARLSAAAVAEAASKIDAAEVENAKAAHAMMAMTNIYYRYLHMVPDKEYQKMPAGLRMQIIGKPPADKLNFELYALAVSVVNGCEFCVAAHEAQLRKHGLSREAIQLAVRLASTLHAIAAVLDAEAAIANGYQAGDLAAA